MELITVILLLISIIIIIMLIIEKKKYIQKLSNAKEDLKSLEKKAIEEKSNCLYWQRLQEQNQKILKDVQNSIIEKKTEAETEQNRLKELLDTEYKAYEKSVEEKKENTQKEYEIAIFELKQLLETEQNKLNEVISKRQSMQKIMIEEEEMKSEKAFYTLQINEQDLSDISILSNIKKSLNRPDILDKLIYKTYYEKPYTDLVGRVVGNVKKTGIYKITNLIDGKIYIGQAVDIAERWRQHIKRAVGAEPMTSNKLYPAMRDTGVHNFSWQIVEECDKSSLTEREKYWIQFYNGQEYGYNIKG